jgi:hypothetical protein
VLLRDPVGATALLAERLPAVQVIEEFLGVGHGGRRY